MVFVETPTELLPNGSLKLVLPPIDDSQLPHVSIVTITYNRKEFIKLMIRNWLKIDYPKELLEWVVVDDSDDNISFNELKESIEKLADSRINLKRLNSHVNLGLKRNISCKLAKYQYIVHMDSDDFYPKTSVISRIRVLLAAEKRGERIVGCPVVNCYDIITDNSFESFDKCKETGKPYTISESTFAYNKKVWEENNFSNSDLSAEGIAFIEGSGRGEGNERDVEKRDTEGIPCRNVCAMPSGLVITQLTHLSNTITRRPDIKSISNPFTSNLSASDNILINNLKAEILMKDPIWKASVSFIRKMEGKSINEQLEEMKKLPENLLINPMVISYLREHISSKSTSSGKDICYYCGPGSYFNITNPWDPTSQIIGGSEEAVINLSESLVKRGFNVTVYSTTSREMVINGVKYLKWFKWLPLDKNDVTILWRDPSLTSLTINSKKIFLDLHDALDSSWLFNEKKIVEKKITLMMKSNYHKGLLDPENLMSCVVIPNGITSDYKKDWKRGESISSNQKEEDKPSSNEKEIKLICTSSPDRCLEALLRATPIIRKEFPQAHIYWAYGFSAGVSKGGLEADSRDVVKRWVSSMKKLISETEGFHDLGRLSQKEIVSLYSSADYFIYGTNFQEIDCISLTKACSLGVIPITTYAGSLKEKMEEIGMMSYLTKIQKQLQTSLDTSVKEEEFDLWVNEILFNLKYEDTERINERKRISEKTYERKRISEKTYEKYNWESICKQWINEIKEK